MQDKEIIARIHSLYPDAAVDINGEGCKFELFIISNEFEGMSVVKRQQSLLKLFGEELKNGKMHALSIKARTYAEMDSANSHLVQLEM
ncbi:MAG: hypothetical protein AUJ56_10010 [Zetaproteobacteria bacterium CG1_02_49_23]|nr:MAG: hypothetical protein AUJ56_10010 [Zetaproteobacteria bacterium CG1_02_49_23]